MECKQGTPSSVGKGRHLFYTIHWPDISCFRWTVLAYNIYIQYNWKCYVLSQLRVHQGANFLVLKFVTFCHKYWYWSWVTLVSHWQEALGMLHLKTVAWVFLLVSNQESIGFCVLLWFSQVMLVYESESKNLNKVSLWV